MDYHDDDYYNGGYYPVDLDTLLGYNGSSGANLMVNASWGPCESAAPCALEPCVDDSRGWDRLCRLLLPPLYAGVFAAGGASNLVVVAVLWHQPRPQSASDAFLMHLSTADLLLACSMPFWAVEKSRGWVFGRIFCKLLGALYTAAFHASVFLLVGISFERYLSVARALKPRRRPPRVGLVCSLIWLVCLVLAVRDLVYLRPVPAGGEGAPQCAHDFGGRLGLVAVSGFYHVAGFLLPVTVLGFCYGAIGCAVARARSGAQRRREWRAVRLAVAVVAAFLVCWTPFNAALLAETLHRLRADGGRDCRFERHLDGAYDLTRSLGDLHCCLNPLVYAFVGVRFRRQFLCALRDWGVRRPARGWRGRRPPSSVSATDQVFSSASFA
ncbi:C-X-C chemokine receptor type 3-like [Narcine bancroftii]|uniref:C-X-C chemokine receptor type 3-like n=1 Tax=Narcine bancroftii TaxID=1343680 RepID=UPI0038322BDD